ncbi:MAG: hypothetical protein RL685_7461 [Pseudomonadota bacterium]|jgi:hypothetical protein
MNDQKSTATSDSKESDASVGRRRDDVLLLLGTLALILWCVPLAIALRHIKLGASLDAWEKFWMPLALLSPIAITCGAVYHATAWIVRKGTTQRRRSVWLSLLVAGFAGSVPGYRLAFSLLVAIAYLEYRR